jgi:hypothetical protein
MRILTIVSVHAILPAIASALAMARTSKCKIAQAIVSAANERAKAIKQCHR